MDSPSSVFLAIKADLFRDLAFDAIQSESVSRTLNMLEKNSDDTEADSQGNRCFYLSEVVWDGEDIDTFMRCLQLRPSDYIFLQDFWEYPTHSILGTWNHSVWNPGWDEECGLSFHLIH